MICKIETNQKHPTFPVLYQLSLALKVDLTDLYVDVRCSTQNEFLMFSSKKNL